MNKITVVPSNENLDIIRTNDKLDESIKEDLCDLQMKNKELKEFLDKEISIVDNIATDFIVSGNSFDFSWKCYKLRDIVVKQFDSILDLKSNLSMLGLDDPKSVDKLKKVTNMTKGTFMTVLLYYGAPDNSGEVISGIRFIDVIGAEGDSKARQSFLRYSRTV